MDLQVIRYSSTGESTLGLFYIDGQFACYTLEDEARTKKVVGETRIPAGRYRIRLLSEGEMHQRYALKFPGMHQGMLHVTDVPGFTFVLIHIGNTDDDTSGCLLVGDKANNNTTVDGFISSSTGAYKRIYPLIATMVEEGEEVWITYHDHLPIDVYPQQEKRVAAQVNAEWLDLWDSPDGAVEGQLMKGTSVSIIERGKDWCRVQVEGWVSGEYLESF